MSPVSASSLSRVPSELRRDGAKAGSAASRAAWGSAQSPPLPLLPPALPLCLSNEKNGFPGIPVAPAGGVWARQTTCKIKQVYNKQIHTLEIVGNPCESGPLAVWGLTSVKKTRVRSHQRPLQTRAGVS